MDKHIGNIVRGFLRIMGNEAINKDERTIRAVRIIVASWFNWTQWNSYGAVGFQVQQVMNMLMADVNDGLAAHKLGQMVDLAVAEQTAYKATCADDLAARRLALQLQLDRGRLTARLNTFQMEGTSLRL